MPLAQQRQGQNREAPAPRPGVSDPPWATNASPGGPSASITGDPATRGVSSASRGKGATRGGALASRNVFSIRGSAKKRPTLIEVSSDPNKEQKLYTNWHIRRKAQLAARDMADAAPDLSALGGLFDPSNPSSLQPLKPATLRKASFPNPKLQESDTRRPSIEVDGQPEISDLGEGPTRIEMPLSIANPTSAPGEPLTSHPPIRPAYVHERHGADAICYFWYNRGSCSKGINCPFLHSDDASLPIAPAPNKKAQEITELEKNKAQQSDASLPSNTPDKRPSHLDEERRERQKEREDVVVHHTPQSNSSLLPDPSTSPTLKDNPTRSLRKESSSRPPWNERDPFNSICHFWHTTGKCKNGSTCRYLHTEDGNLPVAPKPTGKSEKTCRFWIKGGCYAGSKCEYKHPSDLTTAKDSIPARIPEPSPQVAVSKAPRKSVSFAIDKPEHRPETPPEEARNLISTSSKKGLPPELRERYDKTCSFWARNNCHHGENCWYNHFHERDRPKETMVQLQSQDETPIDSTLGDHIHESREQQADTSSSLRQTQPHGISESADASPNPIYQEAPPPLNKESSVPKTGTIPPPQDKGAMNVALGGRTKELILGNDEPLSIIVDFKDIGDALQQPWGQSFSAIQRLHFLKMCTAQDFAAQRSTLEFLMLWHGSFTSITDKQVLAKIDHVSQHLRLCSGGFISACKNFNVLIYPAMEEWGFVGAPTNSSSQDTLRYLIFQSSSEIEKPLASKGSAPTLYGKTLVKSLHGLDYNQLLPRHKKGQVFHFYLLFPESNNPTAEFFASWLRASDNRCKIYSSQKKGSWDFFVKSPDIDAGVVLIHESALAYICELPSLSHLLSPSTANKMFTFWCIGDCSVPDASTLGQITVTRILPHGHAFLLTPSFLIAEPERAYYLIRWFREKLKKSTPGTWKLVCAHNIADYLLDLAIEKSFERDAFCEEHNEKPAKDSMAAKRGLSYEACEARFKCHAAISGMLSRYLDESSDTYESDRMDGDDSPVVYADESISPDDEQALVVWFAGWSITKLEQFRRYTVVGTSSSSSDRAVRMKEIAVIQPPSSKSLTNPGTPIKNPEPTNQASVAELSMEAGKLRALAVAAKLNSSSPNKPPSTTHPTTSTSIPPSKPPLQPVGTLGPYVVSVPKPNSSSDAAPKSPAPSTKATLISVDGSAEIDTNSNSQADNGARRTVQIDDIDDSRDQMDIDAQVLDLIASVQAEEQRRLPPLVTEGLGKAAKPRVPLSVESATKSTSSASQRGVMISESSPQTGITSPFSPPQFDGSGDERSQYSGSNSGRFGIATDHNGRQLVRPDGHFPPEDRYRDRRTIDGVLQSGPSSRQSPASGDAMDIDPPEEETSRTTSVNTFSIRGRASREKGRKEAGDRVKKEVRYEVTTAWYGRLKAEGKGWEHIYVDGWEKCFRNLGAMQPLA